MAAITGKFTHPVQGQSRQLTSMVGELLSSGGVLPEQMPHAFWRLKLLANNGSNNPSVRELAFYGDDYATELTLSGTGLSSTYYAGGEPYLAFDGDRTTEWSGSSSIAIGSSYLGFQFTDPVVVTGFRLLQNDYYTYLVTQVQLEYSDNGVTWYSKGSAISFSALGYTSYTDFENAAYVVDGVIAGLPNLPAITIDGSIGNGASLTNDELIYLPSIEIDAGIHGIISPLPLITIEASSSVSQTVGTGSAALPSINCAAQATSSDDGSISATLTLPKLACEGADVVGVRVSLPAITGLGTCVQNGYGEIAVTLPALNVSSSGETENLIVSSVALPALIAEASSLLGQIGSVNVEMAKLALAAEGLTGTISSVSVSLPLAVVDADSIHDTTATVSVELPVLVLEATAPEAALVVSGAYVLNLSNGALTEFDAFAYNSMAVFNGQIVVASSSGLFLLTGASDNGSPINASARLPLGDMGASNLKRISAAYVGYRSNGELSFTVAVDGGDEYSYMLENTGAPGAFGGRAKPGRGLEGRYLVAGIDSDGATMNVSDVELEVEVLSKKAG